LGVSEKLENRLFVSAFKVQVELKTNKTKPQQNLTWKVDIPHLKDLENANQQPESDVLLCMIRKNCC
jgi:hypothetical protein